MFRSPVMHSEGLEEANTLLRSERVFKASFITLPLSCAHVPSANQKPRLLGPVWSASARLSPGTVLVLATHFPSVTFETTSDTFEVLFL